MINLRYRCLALALALLAPALKATDFYVASNGSASGDGSKAQPWDLATALAQPRGVKAGDTIWVRGGTYVGHFKSLLRGEADKPIVVRPYPGEWFVIDGNDGSSQPTLLVNGNYTWFWGFEITNSNTTRATNTTNPPPGRGEAVHLLGGRTKLINMVLHDTAQGVLTTTDIKETEVNGCLIYYNGWDGSDRGHGHGIYIQNAGPTPKRIVDNIIFGQYSYGVHGYTEGGKLNNIYLEGNTSFNNGVLSQVSGPTTNFLIGASGAAAPDPVSSDKVAKNSSLVSNYSYFPAGVGTGANLGFSKGTASPTILDNYLVGGRALALVNAFRPITMSGNTLTGTLAGFEASEFPSNAYNSNRPTGVKVFVRPNQYEPGRANITVYNWDRAATVGVSLKGVLKAGTVYEIRNAQNFFGPPVLSGTYDGDATLQLPMNALTAAVPIGRPAPAATGPEFQVFVVLPKASGSISRPPAAAFSFGPGSPVAGDAVTFRDLTNGGPVLRTWDFGDPGSGASNTSSADAPTHTYTAPGNYTVHLTIANENGSSTRTREVTIAGASDARSAILPLAGHVLGATGTTFVTDVVVENPSTDPVSARLVFSPSGSGPPLESSRDLAPGETLVLGDVVASEFGADNALGSLRVEVDGTSPAGLRLAGRTYVDVEGATLGLGAVGFPGTASGSAVRYLSNLSITDAFRTNFGAVNTTDESETFTIQLRDGFGNVLGRKSLTLAAATQQQWALAQLFPDATGAGLTLRIVPAAGSLAPLAYAAVIDNASSDPTYYSALEPSPILYVPGLAAISGVDDAFFRSELSIANTGEGPATVTLTFLEHDRSNSNPPTQTLVLEPWETLHTDDALQDLFGLSGNFGAVQVQSDGSAGVVVFERLLTESASSEGTVGQQIDTVSAEDLLVIGSLLGVRQDDAFRTNVGLVNPGSSALPVKLTLVRSPAQQLGVTTVTIPPRGYVQRNLAALFSSVHLPEGESLSIRLDGGGHPFLAFASVIDNTSQDPTYYPQLP